MVICQSDTLLLLLLPTYLNLMAICSAKYSMGFDYPVI